MASTNRGSKPKGPRKTADAAIWPQKFLTFGIPRRHSMPARSLR